MSPRGKLLEELEAGGAGKKNLDCKFVLQSGTENLRAANPRSKLPEAAPHKMHRLPSAYPSLT